MGDLEALALRCEAAAGADRSLDADIAVALNADSLPGARKERGDDEVRALGFVRHLFSGSRSVQEARRYTASLDAAMTLVEGVGVLITLSEIKGDGTPHCVIGNPGTAELFEAVADTMPLALCAAALRARASVGAHAERGDPLGAPFMGDAVPKADAQTPAKSLNPGPSS